MTIETIKNFLGEEIYHFNNYLLIPLKMKDYTFFANAEIEKRLELFCYGNIYICDNLEDTIAFIEIIKGFANKRLSPQKIYKYPFFSAKIREKEKDLSIQLEGTKGQIVLDRMDAQILGAQLHKYLYNFKF